MKHKNIIFMLSSIIIMLGALAALIILTQLAIDLFVYIFIDTELYWIVCPVGMVFARHMHLWCHSRYG